MTSPDEARDDVAELAALYVLGSLPDEDARWIEQRLERDDPLVVAEVESARLTVAACDLETTEPADAPPSLRERVLASAARTTQDAQTQVWKSWTTGQATSIAAGLATLRSDKGDWEATAVEGVRVKRLFVDAERRVVSMLVQMEPGSSYPPHRHAGPEECLVLDGDLHVEGEVLHAGDYQRAEAASLHGVQSTENGCTLFITSSMDDELVAGA